MNDNIQVAVPDHVDMSLVTRVLEQGKQYKPAICPPEIRRFPIGKCFDASIVNALDRKYRYVEGFAYSRKHGAYVLHAWVTDGMNAFDPTWHATDPENKEVPVPTHYIGIEMAVEKVGKFMIATEYAGVIANYFRNPQLAERCFFP